MSDTLAREYRIVKARSLEDLEEDVRTLLQQGWRTAGGVFSFEAWVYDDEITFFGQALFWREASPAVHPEPRYDEIFQRGTEWLDSLVLEDDDQ